MKVLGTLALVSTAMAAGPGNVYLTIECEACQELGADFEPDYGDVTKAIIAYLEDEMDYKEGDDFVISMPEEYAYDAEKTYICESHDDDQWDSTRNTINANGGNVCLDFRITEIPENQLSSYEQLKDYMYDSGSRRPTETFHDEAGLKGGLEDYDFDADEREGDGGEGADPSPTDAPDNGEPTAADTKEYIYLTLECKPEYCDAVDADHVPEYTRVHDAIVTFLEDELKYREGADRDFLVEMPAVYQGTAMQPYVCEEHEGDEWDSTRKDIDAKKSAGICLDLRVVVTDPKTSHAMKQGLVEHMYYSANRFPTTLFHDEARLAGDVKEYLIDGDDSEDADARTDKDGAGDAPTTAPPTNSPDSPTKDEDDKDDNVSKECIKAEGDERETELVQIHLTIQCKTCISLDDEKVPQYSSVMGEIEAFLEQLGYNPKNGDFLLQMPDDYQYEAEEPYICGDHKNDEWASTRSTINNNGGSSSNVCLDVLIDAIPPWLEDKMKDDLVDLVYHSNSRNPTTTFHDDVGLKGLANEYLLDADDTDGTTSQTDECFVKFCRTFGAPAFHGFGSTPVCGSVIPDVTVNPVEQEEKAFAKALSKAVGVIVDDFTDGDCNAACGEAIEDLYRECTSKYVEEWAWDVVYETGLKLVEKAALCPADSLEAVSKDIACYMERLEAEGIAETTSGAAQASVVAALVASLFALY